MSRIGKLPIAIPSGVEVKVGADVVEVKGAKAALTTPVSTFFPMKWPTATSR